jgi:hypothetical protein
MSKSTDSEAPQVRDPRAHTPHLNRVENARAAYDEAQAAVDSHRDVLHDAVRKAVTANVPIAYVASAADWARAQVYRVLTDD